MAGLSVADQVVGEGDGHVGIVVRLSAPSATPVAVAYETQNVGNALSSYDFQGVSGTLSFAAGETAKTVRVNLLQVATYDSGELEHFRFNLSSPINATLATSSAMISIVDNDTIVATPGLFVRDVIVDEKAG
jgi:chitinase